MGLQHLTSIKTKFIDFKIDGEPYKAKQLTGSEYKEFQKEIAEIKGDGKRVFHSENVHTSLMFHALYDGDGEKVFKQKSDRALIEDLPQTLITEISEYLLEANGMNTTSGEKVKN